MKKILVTQISLATSTVVAGLALSVLPTAALKASATGTASTSSSQTQLQPIKNRGNTEINRRLVSLNKLGTVVNSATKLSAADKASLSGEVSSEISNLQNLQTTLNAETTVANARNDDQSVINNYRVYALVTPKVYLVKTADDQQVTEAKLTALSSKLQARVGSSNSTLTNMNNQLNAAQGISSHIETSVVGLQPSDYDSNHSVLSGDRDQLKNAQSDIQTAITDAKQVISSLKS